MDPTAAPVDMPIRGKTYQAYPFRDIEHVALDKWVRREYLKRIDECYDSDPKHMKVAHNTVVTMSWLSEVGIELVYTFRGTHKMAELLCRGKGPTEDELKDADALASVHDTFAFLHGMKESENSDKGSENKEPEKN